MFNVSLISDSIMFCCCGFLRFKCLHTLNNSIPLLGFINVYLTSRSYLKYCSKFSLTYYFHKLKVIYNCPSVSSNLQIYILINMHQVTIVDPISLVDCHFVINYITCVEYPICVTLCYLIIRSFKSHKV